MCVASGDGGGDTTTYIELTDDFARDWLHGSNEVIEDDVDDIFEEMSFIAEGPEVELEGFELNTALCWNVADADSAKVRLAGDGADRSVFGTGMGDDVVTIRMRIGEGFKSLRGLGRHRLSF